MQNLTCKRLTYRGRVQGVGFRYTAQSLAESFPVAGWVRNMPDGTVEMEVEGPAEQVTAFLDAVARHMDRYIERVDVRDGTPGGHQGFQIRR